MAGITKWGTFQDLMARRQKTNDTVKIRLVKDGRSVVDRKAPLPLARPFLPSVRQAAADGK